MGLFNIQRPPLPHWMQMTSIMGQDGTARRPGTMAYGQPVNAPSIRDPLFPSQQHPQQPRQPQFYTPPQIETPNNMAGINRALSENAAKPDRSRQWAQDLAGGLGAARALLDEGATAGAPQIDPFEAHRAGLGRLRRLYDMMDAAQSRSRRSRR